MGREEDNKLRVEEWFAKREKQRLVIDEEMDSMMTENVEKEKPLED